MIKVNFDKYFGAFMGAVVGDALGWPYENRSNNIGGSAELANRLSFIEWTRSSGGVYYKHKEIIRAGEYSDDSQLLLATARSLTYQQEWSRVFMKLELPTWLLYQRGGGGATIRAAESWSRGIVPWKNKELAESYFNAGGNGVAMRILPHVFASSDSFREIAKQVVINGISTHGHPRAILGAIIYARALYHLTQKTGLLEYGELISLLIHNNDWEEFPNWYNANEWLTAAEEVTDSYGAIWVETIKEIRTGLDIIQKSFEKGLFDNTYETLAKLDCFNPKKNGAGTVTSLSALYIASKYATDPYTGLLEVLSFKNADSDTLVSMIGGLMGALYGQEWIRSEWYGVQDFSYIKSLITKQLNNEGAIYTRGKWSDKDSNGVRQGLKSWEVGQSILFGTFGKSVVVEKSLLETNIKNLEVFSFKFQTEEGQLIFLKSYNKTKQTENHIKSVINEAIDEQPSIKNVEILFINANQLQELASYIPGRMYGKRAFQMIAKILERLADKNKLTPEEIELLSTELVQPGIDQLQVRTIIKLLNEKIRKS